MTLVASGIVTLTSGRAACQVAPRSGGAIAAFWWEENGRRIDWLRRTSQPAIAAGDAGEMAAFPLIPYGSRIRDGRFFFSGREVIEAPPLPELRHALHGHGWRREWTVTELAEECIRLDYEHAPAAWPWRYRARQIIALSADTLTVTLEIENLSDELMPAGLGYHPFFPRTPETMVKAASSGVWLTDGEVLPTARVPVPPGWDLSRAPRVAGLALDNVFTGWNGEALMVWPERQARLALEATQPLFSFLVVYTPQAHDYFCVEPASHCTDAVNLARAGEAGTGLRVLAPGARRSGRIVFRPERS